MSDISSRLREARKLAGWDSAAAAARRFQWNYTTYASHENGQTVPPTKWLTLYADAFGVRADWLISGRGFMSAGKPKLVSGYDPDASEPIQADDPTSVGLGVTTNDRLARNLPPGTIVEHLIYGGAGNGGDAMEVMVGGERGEAATDLWSFPPAFLKNELHLSLTASDIVRVRGDSMEPALWDGDRVIVDRTDTNVRVDGIFAISDEGSLIIKQVEIVRGTNPIEIVCKSRNPTYSAFNLKLGGNTRVIGRVVARIGRV